MQVFLKNVHLSWRPILVKALSAMDITYLKQLQTTIDWLPGIHAIFNAFSIPLESTRYIMFGESPYPRQASANGYAFWDNAVIDIWSKTGFSKPVNRATSLRNFIKMLLVARNDLSLKRLTQEDIIHINKSNLIKSISELFNHLLENGFLLLNASLVLSSRPVKEEARFWLPFMQTLLQELALIKHPIKLILLGNIAKTIGKLPEAATFPQFIAEHPYNISFIHNPTVLDFFQPFDLLQR